MLKVECKFLRSTFALSVQFM